MKLCRQIAARTFCSENNRIHFVALRELNNLVKTPPVTIKCEFKLYILDLVVYFHIHPYESAEDVFSELDNILGGAQ